MLNNFTFDKLQLMRFTKNKSRYEKIKHSCQWNAHFNKIEMDCCQLHMPALGAMGPQFVLQQPPQRENVPGGP